MLNLIEALLLPPVFLLMAGVACFNFQAILKTAYTSAFLSHLRLSTPRWRLFPLDFFSVAKEKHTNEIMLMVQPYFVIINNGLEQMFGV